MAYGENIDRYEPATLARAHATLGPVFDALLRPQVSGLEHLRHDGPALVVGNHSGGQLAMFEPLFFSWAARAIGLEKLPTLLLHDVMWRTPLAPWLERAGAVRASAENANALLAAGRKVLVYPGGDREVFRPFARRDRIELGDRRGYVKLAIEHGVPIVPVVTTGLQSGFVPLFDGASLARRFPLARRLRVGVLPVTLSFPFGLSIGIPFPYVPLTTGVSVRALPPIHFPRTGAAAAADAAYVERCHEHVRTTMQVALHALADERRASRREGVLAMIERGLRWLESLTLAPREPVAIAPLPERVSLAPVFELRPSRAPERRAA